MDNRVYYGEYSLRHWIDLVLRKNIILPDYQRYFVWSERKVITLIETFKKRQFVPPVTIGAFKIEGSNQNLILDGQQRITSILLAYLSLYPDAQTYRQAIELFASDNDESNEDDESPLDNILEWNINSLTKKGKSKSVRLNPLSLAGKTGCSVIRKMAQMPARYYTVWLKPPKPMDSFPLITSNTYLKNCLKNQRILITCCPGMCCLLNNSGVC